MKLGIFVGLFGACNFVIYTFLSIILELQGTCETRKDVSKIIGNIRFFSYFSVDIFILFLKRHQEFKFFLFLIVSDNSIDD